MSIFEGYKQRHAEKTRRENERKAEYVYQIEEHDGEIWLIYNGALVCPCSMLKAEPVDALKQMRELYVKRQSE